MIPSDDQLKAIDGRSNYRDLAWEYLTGNAVNPKITRRAVCVRAATCPWTPTRRLKAGGARNGLRKKKLRELRIPALG